jgi:hypothetical protein
MLRTVVVLKLPSLCQLDLQGDVPLAHRMGFPLGGSYFRRMEVTAVSIQEPNHQVNTPSTIAFDRITPQQVNPEVQILGNHEIFQIGIDIECEHLYTD